MRRADFCRAEQARRRRVAHAQKLSQDGFKAERDVTRDVFEEDPLWAALGDDPSDIWPEVARIVGSSAFASGAEGLAGIPGEDGVEGPAEGPGIECPQIIPDRRWGEVACTLGRDEDVAGIPFPLDESAGVIAAFGQHEAQIQASAACAEGQSVPGT